MVVVNCSAVEVLPLLQTLESEWCLSRCFSQEMSIRGNFTLENMYESALDRLSLPRLKHSFPQFFTAVKHVSVKTLSSSGLVGCSYFRAFGDVLQEGASYLMVCMIRRGRQVRHQVYHLERLSGQFVVLSWNADGRTLCIVMSQVPRSHEELCIHLTPHGSRYLSGS